MAPFVPNAGAPRTVPSLLEAARERSSDRLDAEAGGDGGTGPSGCRGRAFPRRHRPSVAVDRGIAPAGRASAEPRAVADPARRDAWWSVNGFPRRAGPLMLVVVCLMRQLGILLLLAIVGCDGGSSPDAGVPAQAEADVDVNVETSAPGMSKYPYLATDGGPHLLLPVEAAESWSGASSMAAVMNPRSDYGRACAATANARMALIPVGPHSAVVFANPPMTAWGRSADGLVEVYYLRSWTRTDLDALIAKATAALPTASLVDTGRVIRFEQPDAYLLYAGDTPSSVVYHCHRVSVPAGTYTILEGNYSAQGESVTVYRLRPADTQQGAR